MSKAPEEINKREIVLDDGRYMIFYTVAPPDGRGAEDVSVPVVTTDQPDEEN